MAAVRVDERTHRIIREIAAQDHEGMPDVVAKAVEDYRRRRFLESANEAYAALRARSEGRAEELAERAAWDDTADDGIEDD